MDAAKPTHTSPAKLYKGFEASSGSLYRLGEAKSESVGDEFSLCGAREDYSRGFYENVPTWDSQTRIVQRRSEQNVFTRIEDQDGQKNLHVSLQRDLHDPDALNLVVNNPAQAGEGEIVIPFSGLAATRGLSTDPVLLADSVSDLWIFRDEKTTQMGFTDAASRQIGLLTLDESGFETTGGYFADRRAQSLLSNAVPSGGPLE